MTIRVVVVDDAIIPRAMVSKILRAQPDMEVVGSSVDGHGAVQQAQALKPDIMVLDIEMPNMTGLEALPEIIRVSPETKIIMSSTLTKRNAAISLEALQLGASDYLAKPEAGDPDDTARYEHELLAKISALATQSGNVSACRSPAAPAKPTDDVTPKASPAAPSATTQHSTVSAPKIKRSFPMVPPIALAIASSTGGPQALTTLFEGLGQRFTSVPVFVTQHMPAVFTMILAENLRKASGLNCAEAQDGEIAENGRVYVAPGDYHMRVKQKGRDTVIALDKGPMVNFCRPAADPMIESLVEVYGNRLLLVVLTGMGQDGLCGARLLHQAGGTIAAQDQQSSVVWGMPKAVNDANLASTILPLHDMASYLKKAFGVL